MAHGHRARRQIVSPRQLRPLAIAVKCASILASVHSHFLRKYLTRNGETVSNKRWMVAQDSTSTTMQINASKIIAATCRWTARVLGVVFVVSVITLAIGEGMPNPLDRKSTRLNSSHLVIS